MRATYNKCTDYILPPQYINSMHTLREATLDSAVKESLPEGKRVKFNLEDTTTSEADDALPLADEDLGSAGHDDVVTQCDTGIQAP